MSQRRREGISVEYSSLYVHFHVTLGSRHPGDVAGCQFSQPLFVHLIVWNKVSTKCLEGVFKSKYTPAFLWFKSAKLNLLFIR